MSLSNKKKALLASALSCAFSTPVYADILGVYAGAGVWQASLSGDIGIEEIDSAPATADELGLDDNQNTFIYAAFEHPVPIIPNARISVNNISVKGDATIQRDININQPVLGGDGIRVPANADTQTDIDLSHIDFTLYYEVLDNYVSLDVGLTARDFNSEAKITYQSNLDPDQNGEESITFDEIIPMLYLKAQLDLPFTGWYAGGSANVISFDDNSVTDAEVKVGYLTSGLGLDLGFDLGYRSFSLKAETDDNDLNADLTLSGVYAGFNVHF